MPPNFKLMEKRGDAEVKPLSVSEGAYFRKEDYAGFWLRLFIDLVDIIVVAVVAVLLSMLKLTYSPTDERQIQILFLLWAAILFLYFVILKWTNIGTVGYLIGKVRIVNLKGERPSLFLLTLRLLFAAIGPFNIILDLLWLSGDEHKQTKIRLFISPNPRQISLDEIAAQK